MSSAFGEPPDSGVRRSADAPGTAMSNAASAAARAAGSRQRVKRLGKAGGSYLRPQALLHFVPHVPSGAARPREGPPWGSNRWGGKRGAAGCHAATNPVPTREAANRARCRAAGCAAAALSGDWALSPLWGGSAEPPLSNAGASSARIDPRTAAAARSPRRAGCSSRHAGRPRLAEPGSSPPACCPRRRLLGWLGVASALPSGPARRAPRKWAPTMRSTSTGIGV
jgi:hypothetical protein